MSINYNYEHRMHQSLDIGVFTAEEAWQNLVQMVEQKYHCCKLSPRVEFRVEGESTVYGFQVELPDRRMATIFDLEVIPQLQQTIEVRSRTQRILRDMHQSIMTSLWAEISEEIDKTVLDSFE